MPSIHSDAGNSRLSQPRGARIAIALLAGLGITTVGLGGYNLLSSRKTQVTPLLPADPLPAIKAVTALGRLEPQGEVIQLAASEEGSRLDQLLVKHGNRVQQGQVIAILDTRARLQAALDRAKQQVEVAQTRLAQVEAGAKSGEINAQKATISRIEAQLREEVVAKEAAIARLEAEVENAETEYLRHDFLQEEGAISASQRDNKQLTWAVALERLKEAQAERRQTEETLSKQLREAKATLNQIAEVRPVDVQAARAEVASALAAVQQAQAELELAYIKAPRTGQILKIHTWEGEIVDSQNGVVSLGETSQMYAVAEVYESDIPKISSGQSATVTSDSLSNQQFQGVVDEVGLEVAKKDVLNTDPAADIDARVVEVKVRLDPQDSQKLAGFTNLKVKVAIDQ